MYDLIGDLHGHADELRRLLHELGYRESRGAYRHPNRQVVFLGDFIDRGPKIRETLDIVRRMVEEGAARAVMGNHEWNALAYHTPDPAAPDKYLRRRNPKNEKQHGQTLAQLTEVELASALAWFRTLPMWLDLDGVRAVHACWDDRAVAAVSAALDDSGSMPTELLYAAAQKGKPLFLPVKTLLKGKELALPAGVAFQDKEGYVRTEFRTRWYLPADGHTYRTYAFQMDAIECDLELAAGAFDDLAPYPADAKPLFIGHYWLSAARPASLAPNLACLDYSVAKGGYLCAYRWDGERTISNEKFVFLGGAT